MKIRTIGITLLMSIALMSLGYISAIWADSGTSTEYVTRYSSIRLTGKTETINGQSISILLLDTNNNVSLATGTVTITDAGSGYAKGAIYIKTDVATGTASLYQNVGTSTSCNFDLTMASGAIVDSDVSATAEIAVNKLASGSDAQMLVTKGGNIAWITPTSIALSNSGFTIPVGYITTGMVNDLTITNGDISASAEITLSKIAECSDGQVIIGNASGVNACVSPSGAISIITNAGAFTIPAGYITTGMVNDSTLTNADISASAEIAISKLAECSDGQIIIGNANGTNVCATPSGILTGLNNAGGGATIPAGYVTTGMVNDGTLLNADVNASAGITLSKLFAGSDGQLMVGNANGTNAWKLPTGAIAFTNEMVGTIPVEYITGGMINASAEIAISKLAECADGQIIVGNASGVNACITPTGILTGLNNAGGGATIPTGHITTGMINDLTIANADINATAEITVSKLANGADGQIPITQGNDVAYATWSGDVGLTNALVSTVAANAITASKLFTNAVSLVIATGTATNSVAIPSTATLLGCIPTNTQNVSINGCSNSGGTVTVNLSGNPNTNAEVTVLMVM